MTIQSEVRPPIQPTPPLSADNHQRYVRNCLGWIIFLLVIMAIAAVIVSWNVISLDLFIHHLQQAVNQFSGGGGSGSNCYSQGGTDFSC